MSRISAPADRPIPTNEPKLATQQTSETEGVQKTDQGKAILDAEQSVKQNEQSTDTKGAQYESRLGGLARQLEMQSHFPVPSGPTQKDLPDMRPNPNPNIHLDEKIDLTKNLPDGMAINKGLEGLDWGPTKAKTGPANFGVDATYGGTMKPPKDMLAEVRNGGKPSAPNASGPQKDTRGTMTTTDKSVDGGGVKGFAGKGGPNSPPPGVELSFRAPKWAQVGLSEYKPSAQSQQKQEAMAKAEQAERQRKADEKEAKKAFEKRQYEEPKPKEYVDPDAGGGGVIPSANDIERIVKVHVGAVSHGVNPDLGLGDGPNRSSEAMDRDPGNIDRDPDYVEATADKPNLGNKVQPDTRPELQQGPKPGMPPAGVDPKSNPS
jgi:hypothetical protein